MTAARAKARDPVAPEVGDDKRLRLIRPKAKAPGAKSPELSAQERQRHDFMLGKDRRRGGGFVTKW